MHWPKSSMRGIRESIACNNRFTLIDHIYTNLDENISRVHVCKDSLSYSGPVIWNAIPSDVKHTSTINDFTRKIINWIRDA